MTKEFPFVQVIVAGLCRFAEPVALTSIFPYTYFMVKWFNHGSEEKIAKQVGYISSAFPLAQMTSAVFWASLSDQYGRKIVLISGMCGTAISCIIFGFASNVYMAVLGRALAGLLNGNVAVIRTMLAEIATVKLHQVYAFAVMPLIFQAGSILGPTLGGNLADPRKNHPNWFSEDSIFAHYPFLLPNLTVSLLLVCSMIFATTFLKETLSNKKPISDLWRTKERDSETSPLLSDDSETVEEPLSILDILKGKIMHNIISYFFLAFHTICFDQLFSVFLATPKVEHKLFSFIEFSGGMGWDTKKIGSAISVSGAYSMVLILVIYPLVHRALGGLSTYRLSWIFFPPAYGLLPYLSYLSEHSIKTQTLCVYGILFLKATGSAFAFTQNNIMLANVTKRKETLGTVNGYAQLSASLARTLGPITAGYLMGVGSKIGMVGFFWWFLMCMASVGFVHCFWVADLVEDDEDIEDIEDN